MTMRGWFAVVLHLLCTVISVRSDSSDHKYTVGDETYRYFDLPFCSPAHMKEKKEALGEVLNGDRLVSAPYKLDFLQDKDSQIVCKKTLSKKEVVQFRKAIIKDYYLQMYYDDLPIWGFLRKVEKEGKSDPNEYKYYLFKHLHFEIFYNLDRVIEINARTDPNAHVDLTEDKENDFVKYAHDEETADDQEETGWKYIHGDVFRYPKYKSFFAAALGSGTQLFTLTVFIFILALVGVFYPYNHGALFTALVVIYALTSGIAGFTASAFYCQLEGTNWVRNLLLTGSLFCGPLFLTFCFLNTVAISYSATAALPFGTIVVIFLIWALVTSPLLVLGGIAGKNSKSEFQAPCRTTKYPREIPQLPWYRGTLPQMAMAGFLPFSAIYIELYYIFASLAAEDHEWWWRSFLCGGSTGLFIYSYCLYYYYARSDMTGFMQTSFFFGYMACICYGFFLVLGTVGFRAALSFVRHIYHSIKCE
ncbi:unnamed protein product [Fraxinus pennsylvanica]|uniref:Transmembrane 9 superfamily member n=1 Tax=Fraxinus pennsylvanica TaxID=56036 RepID=A0AAD2DL95_9LAMI|nr:unnamed protein product [Fraxinus pennsylvanica]